MNSPLRADFTWRCLDLAERVQWIRIAGSREPSRATCREVRRKLLALAPVKAYQHWREWLRYQEISLREFGAAALERPPNPASPFPAHAWECVLAEILQADVARIPEHASGAGGDGLPILGRLLDPFIHWLWTDLRDAVAVAQRQGIVRESGALIDSQLAQVVRAVWPVAQRAFVLEVNKARMTGALKGNTSAARLHEFTDRMRSSRQRLRALYERYPALARLLTTVCMNTGRDMREVLVRYAADASAIASEVFDGVDPGPILRFADVTGDPHEGGRRVRVLMFQNGSRVVYKPRSVEAETAFQTFVTWVNRAGFPGQLPTLKILSRPTHGWSNFVAPASMSDPDAVRRYYRRIGGWLPVLWAVQGTDFHCENVIAAGESPTPIDLELLFTNQTSVFRRGIETRAERFLRLSVLESGILPATPVSYHDSDESGDMSALGKRERQVWNEPVEGIERAESDEIRVGRVNQQLPFTPNLPRLDGRAVEFAEYEDDVVEGVRAAFDLICKRKHELLADPPELAQLLRCETRVVIRPTVDYIRILWRSYHPDYLRDALSREYCLVTQLRAALRGRPAGNAVVDLEVADLKDGDIPRFRGRPTSCEVNGTGRRQVRLFRRPASATARARIRSLTTTAVRHQQRIVRLALSSHVPRGSDAGTEASDMQQSVHGTAALLDEARAIGRQIRDEAFRVGRTVDWFGLRSCPDGAALGAMGPDLYEGAAGIAVFFAQLSRCWPGDGFDEMARHTVTSARRFTFRRRHPGGAFSGDASICYALLYVGGVLGDTDLVETGLQLLLRAGRTRQVRHGCDLISGAAGLIAVLTTAYEVTGSRPALDLAHDLGEALVSERIVMERGWAWPNDIKSSRPLTGCAHGTAGIASALARLAVATGNAGFDTAARRAVEYERAAYDPVLGGWPEVRMQGVGQDLAQQTASSWCYGSLGVVLARLSARAEWAPDDRAEIDELLCRIAATPMQGNDCVCHGECGVVETLIAASTGLSDASWLDLARRRLSAALVRRSSRGTWRGGIPRQERISDPGFMLGRSGIGYQLLRAAQPGVPSVLLLAAPVATAAAAPLALWRTSHLGATV